MVVSYGLINSLPWFAAMIALVSVDNIDHFNAFNVFAMKLYIA